MGYHGRHEKARATALLGGFMAKPRVALALSGGAARGLAHLGALQVLQERGFPLAGLSGSSSGAVIAALYALHNDAEYIARLIRGKNLLHIFLQSVDFGFHRGAIVSGRRFRDWLDREFFFGATFADVHTELAIATTDLARNELVVLNEGSLAEAVRASCALPGFFAPVRVNGRILIDGGFVEPIPFRALRHIKADTLVGIQTGLDVQHSAIVRTIRRFNMSGFGSGFHESAKRMHVRGPLSQVYAGVSIFLRSYDTPIIVPPGASMVTLNPAISWLDFRQLDAAMSRGYQQFSTHIDRYLTPHHNEEL